MINGHCALRESEEGCEATDMTNLILLGMGAQTPHQHVLPHALAKSRDCASVDRVSLPSSSR